MSRRTGRIRRNSVAVPDRFVTRPHDPIKSLDNDIHVLRRIAEAETMQQNGIDERGESLNLCECLKEGRKKKVVIVHLLHFGERNFIQSLLQRRVIIFNRYLLRPNRFYK